MQTVADAGITDQSQALQCEHCGVTSPHVGVWLDYVGGQGHVQRRQCRDTVACWQCYDRAHKIQPA